MPSLGVYTSANRDVGEGCLGSHPRAMHSLCLQFTSCSVGLEVAPRYVLTRRKRVAEIAECARFFAAGQCCSRATTPCTPLQPGSTVPVCVGARPASATGNPRPGFFNTAARTHVEPDCRGAHLESTAQPVTHVTRGGDHDAGYLAGEERRDASCHAPEVIHPEPGRVGLGDINQNRSSGPHTWIRGDLPGSRYEIGRCTRADCRHHDELTIVFEPVRYGHVAERGRAPSGRIRHGRRLMTSQCG